MITLPKPKFSEIQIAISKDDYLEQITEMQTHVLNDAIDRVSFKEI